MVTRLLSRFLCACSFFVAPWEEGCTGAERHVVMEWEGYKDVLVLLLPQGMEVLFFIGFSSRKHCRRYESSF